MALTSKDTKKIYTGDGITTVFNAVFPFREVEDVAVRLISAGTPQDLVYLTDYTVAKVGGSGTVTLTTAPANGVTVAVHRKTNPVQTHEYPNNGRFPAPLVEQALDKLTGLSQEIMEELGRSVRLPITETGFEMPSAAEGHSLVWQGGKLINTVNSLDGYVADALAHKDAAALSAQDALAAQAMAETHKDNAELAATNAQASETSAFNEANRSKTEADRAEAADDGVPVTFGTLATKNTVSAIDIETGAVTTDKLTDGAVTTSKLSTTGVVAGTYNSPTLTVGADGRVTAASNGGGSVDTQQLAKAWVSVNMQGTYTIQDSFNVSSVVDPGTGRCRVNLATPMANIDYVTLGNADNAAGTYDNYIYSIVEYNQQIRTTSKFEMQVSSTNGGRFNSPRAQFIVFGDQ